MSAEQYVLHKIDEMRAEHGFRSVADLLELGESGNVVIDPFSALISSSVHLGVGNFFYPNVIVEAKEGGSVTIGDNNIFYPNTMILAEQGIVTIEDENQFGDGGCAIKANMPDAKISIGSQGRYLNGAQILGQTVLGTGSQILGPITVQNCNLAAGGDFRSSDPDLRAGLLKGSGLAKDLSVPTGMVINGSGVFSEENIELQASYHPKK